MSNGLINNHSEFRSLFEKGQVDIAIDKYKATELMFLAKRYGARRFNVNFALVIAAIGTLSFLGGFLMLIFTDYSFFNKLFIFIGMFVIGSLLTKASMAMKNDIIILTMLSDPNYFRAVQALARIAWQKSPVNHLFDN